MPEVSRRGGQRGEPFAAASQAWVRSRAQCMLGPGTSDAGGAHVDQEKWQQAERGHRSHLQQSGLHRRRQVTIVLKKLRAAASHRPTKCKMCWGHLQQSGYSQEEWRKQP